MKYKLNEDDLDFKSGFYFILNQGLETRLFWEISEVLKDPYYGPIFISLHQPLEEESNMIHEGLNEEFSDMKLL